MFGYQRIYSKEEEEETGYDEFALRTYDPTTGRWLSTDPYDQFASPYLGMGNDPVNKVDIYGEMIGNLFNSLVEWLESFIAEEVSPLTAG